MRDDAMAGRVNRREPQGLPALLRRDAAADRPRFSEVLHRRILQRLPTASAAIRRTVPRVDGRGGSSWRPVSAAVTAAALVVVAAIAGDWNAAAGGRTRSAALVATGPAGGSEVADAGDPGDVAALGIDRVPLFDELEAGVREGVSSLAATLLDVPEWRMLADFDAAGFLGGDSPP